MSGPVQITARWYVDVFPLEVVRQQEAWEQLRLVRRLRARWDKDRRRGKDPEDLVIERSRLMHVPQEMLSIIRDDVSPIERYLAQVEQPGYHVAMLDPVMRERLFAEWDRVTKIIQAWRDRK